MRFPRLLALLGVQAALAVTALEVPGRLIDPLGISYYLETTRFFDRLILEEPIGYAIRAGRDPAARSTAPVVFSWSR